MDIWTITFDTYWERVMITEQLWSLNRNLADKDVKIHVVFNEFMPKHNYKRFIETLKSHTFDITVKFYMVDEIIGDTQVSYFKSQKKPTKEYLGWHIQQVIKLLGPIMYGTYENQLILDSKNILLNSELAHEDYRAVEFLKDDNMIFYKKTIEYYKRLFKVKTNIVKHPTTPFLFKLTTLYQLHDFFEKNNSEMIRHLYNENYAPGMSEFCFYDIFEQKTNTLEFSRRKRRMIHYNDNLSIQKAIYEYGYKDASWLVCRNDEDARKFKRWHLHLRKRIKT